MAQRLKQAISGPSSHIDAASEHPNRCRGDRAKLQHLADRRVYELREELCLLAVRSTLLAMKERLSYPSYP